MKIGITYDTEEMYSIAETQKIHFDFANYSAISRVKKELEALGCEVKLIGNTLKLADLIKNECCNFDIIYNTVEGINSRNREGLVPAILEACGIPYIGTDSFGLSLSLNKVFMKILALHLGIKTPKYCVFQYQADKELEFSKLNSLKLPVIIKPNLEGNSSGISVCDTYEQAQHKIIELLGLYKTAILCEEFIYGKEITVPVIGNQPNLNFFGVTTVNIQKDDNFWLDMNLKVYGDYQNEILPLSPKLYQEFRRSVSVLFDAIGCNDFARFDFRLSPDNEIYFIEVNPLPCLFKGGSFDIVGQHLGYTYSETLKLIINTACDRLSIPRI